MSDDPTPTTAATPATPTTGAGGARDRRAGQAGQASDGGQGGPGRQAGDDGQGRQAGDGGQGRQAGDGGQAGDGVAGGSRFAGVEIEVPGTPEEVWAAIATGEGISAWFGPATVEPRPDGALEVDLAGFGTLRGRITAWAPPWRFGWEEASWPGTDDPRAPWVTEILVDARPGGTCRVRLVTGFFAHGDDWADEVEGSTYGWRQGLHHLRLYLTHFRGLRTTRLLVEHAPPPGGDEIRPLVLGALGLADARVGDQVHLSAGGTGSPAPPEVRGVVEAVYPELVLVRTTEPVPALLMIGAVGFLHPTDVVRVVTGYLYGDAGAAAAAELHRTWQTWVADVVRPVSERNRG
jgi:uncharacterized protein YndB with AHSA1/START domain